MQQPYHLFNDALIDAQSMSSDITSDPYNINEAISFSVQAIWSNGSSPVGDFVLQGSNDNSTFTDLTSGSVSGNSGSILINVEKPAYAWIRLFYDRTSGSGTLTAIVNGKRG